MLRQFSVPVKRTNKKVGKLVYNNNKDEEMYDIDPAVFDREKIISQIRDLNDNIDRIGVICTNKKNRTNEENIKKFCLNKAMIDEELSKIKFKLSEALKNSAKEDLLKKLQHDLTTKRNQVSDTDKDVQNLNKVLFSYQHKIERLKEENNFLIQEIRNSKDYQLYLENKKTELEETNKEKSSMKNVNTSEHENQLLNNMIDSSVIDEIKEKQTEKLQKYFDKTEEMLRNKIMLEDKILREKYNKLKNLNNFQNAIQDIMRKKIKMYQKKQVNQMTEKVTNREIFFSLNDSKDIAKSKIIKNNLTTLKIKSEDNNKLNEKDKKEIMKMMLEDEDMKKIIFSYLFE